MAQDFILIVIIHILGPFHEPTQTYERVQSSRWTDERVRSSRWTDDHQGYQTNKMVTVNPLLFFIAPESVHFTNAMSVKVSDKKDPFSVHKSKQSR